MPERTPEEREAARLERERKRAKKRGETSESAAVVPVDPVRYDSLAFSEPEPAEAERLIAAGELAEPQEPDFGTAPAPAQPTGERPIGTKRLGQPGGASRPGAKQAARRRRGIAGAYQAYKDKPRGVPKTSRGLRRKGPIALLVLALILLWFLISLFQPFKGDGSGSVTLTIPQGSTNGEIAELLADEDVIGSKFFFGLRVRMSGAELQSGTFALKRDMSFGAAIDALSGPGAVPATMRIVVPEGKSRRETATIAQRDGLSGDYVDASRRSSLLKPSSYGAPKGATLEGFLFPATYELKPGSSSKRLVNDQLRAFKRQFAAVDMTRAKRRNLSEFDVITIASMIEREATVPSERRKIAAVIYNRLRQGMALGIDATVRFAVDNWDSPLKQSELNSTSPYNTRNHTGLPPGPIGSPGLAAMQAAANPTGDDYLFYVVKPCGKGTHNFSSTDAEFQRDVATYNAARERNGGNDPSNATDC